MEFAGYAATVIMGMTLALFGGGGSILTVPILVYLFAVPPVFATAYSLLIVGTTSAVGAISFARRHLVAWGIGATFAIPGVVGVVLARRFLIPAIPEILSIGSSLTFTRDTLIMVVFSALMLAAAAGMLRPRNNSSSASDIDPRLNMLNLRKGAIIAVEGMIVGFLTGFVGAGGGFLIIPALVILTGLSMQTAVATSLVIIAAKSLLGFLGDYQRFTQMDFSLLTGILTAAIIGVAIGTWVATKIPSRRLQPTFAIFVLAMGIVVMVQSLGI